MESTHFFIDVDGTLAENKFYFTHTGEKVKSFHVADTSAFAELLSSGWNVTLITASKWRGCESYCKKNKINLLVSRDKFEVVKELLDGKSYYACGNDWYDYELLLRAEKAFCPSDSIEEVKQIPGIVVLNAKGGNGVVDEIVRLLSK